MSENKFMKDTAYDVFISHATEDKKTADAMCHYLEEQKIRCWIAPRDILPGQDFADAIAQAIKKTKIFVLVCSNFSLKSNFVQKETNLAVSDEKIIIPFKIDDSPLDGGMRLYLNDRHWIEAVPKPEEAFGDLADAIIAFLSAKASDLGEKPPVSVEKTSTLGEEAPNSAERPSPETKYEFEGTSFSKAQILRLANFQNWLLFCEIMTLLLYTLVPFLLYHCLGEHFAICLAVLYCIDSVLNLIFLLKLSFLQKENLVMTILFAPVMFVPLFGPVILFEEIGRSKKILHTAGLKTFWGWMPKSEIRRFAEDSGPQAER